MLIMKRFFFMDRLGRNNSKTFKMLKHHLRMIFRFWAARRSSVLLASSRKVTSRCQCILSTLQWPRITTYDRFRVQSIEYNDQREISALVIVNSLGKVVYSWIAPKVAASKPEESCLSTAQMNNLQKELVRTGVALEAVLERYHLSRPEEMSPDIYKQAMTALKKTRVKGTSAA